MTKILSIELERERESEKTFSENQNNYDGEKVSNIKQRQT